MMAILASLGISISTICINGENMTDGKIMAVENHPSTLYYFLCLPRAISPEVLYDMDFLSNDGKEYHKAFK